MEAEAAEIRHGAAVLLLSPHNAGSAETVCAICEHRYSANRLLHPCRQLIEHGIALFHLKRRKQCFLALHDLIDSVIVAYNAAQIYRDDCLGLGRNHSLQLVIVHFRHMGRGIAVLLDIYKLDGRATMTCGRSRRCVGIGRHQDFVPGPYAPNAQIQFLRRRGRVHTCNPVCIASCVVFRIAVNVHAPRLYIGRQPALQELSPGACRNPAGLEGLHNFRDLHLADIRGTERYDMF